MRRSNPGVDMTYELALPTYAATAWYHKKLPTQPAELEPFLKEVRAFAMDGYAHALALGTDHHRGGEAVHRGEAARIYRDCLWLTC